MKNHTVPTASQESLQHIEEMVGQDDSMVVNISENSVTVTDEMTVVIKTNKDCSIATCK